MTILRTSLPLEGELMRLYGCGSTNIFSQSNIVTQQQQIQCCISQDESSLLPKLVHQIEDQLARHSGSFQAILL